MKTLIAVTSCHRFAYADKEDQAPRYTRERLTTCRSTWLRDCEYRVFFGASGHREPLSDEVFLSCPDDYKSLPAKTREICRWALQRDYDFLYRTDDDTFVYVDRLLRSGFEKHDYSGYCLPYPQHLEKYRYHGAPGFWLSRRAMQVVAESDYLTEYADDLWIGSELYQQGIKAFRDTRHVPGFDSHFVNFEGMPSEHPYIAFHSCTPDTMQRLITLPVKGVLPAPDMTWHEPDFNFQYGKRSASCRCSYCIC